MRKLIVIMATALIALLYPANIYAAGTVTQAAAQYGYMLVVTFSWTADAAAATVPSTDTSAAITTAITQGYYLSFALTNPGSTAPTANYDIVINDADGVDVMGGALANRSATASEAAWPPVAARPITGTLTLVISNNAVNSATGTVALYFTKEPTPGTSSGTVTVTGVATAANQTSGDQKTQVVDGSGNVIGATSNAMDINVKSGVTVDTAVDAPASENPVRLGGTFVSPQATVGTSGDKTGIQTDAYGNLYAIIRGTASIGNGRKTVTTAGSAVALASTTSIFRVVITALSGNTGVIVVGGSGVVASLSTRSGTPLLAGDTVILDVDDLAKVYIDSTVNGEGVSFTYLY